MQNKTSLTTPILLSLFETSDSLLGKQYSLDKKSKLTKKIVATLSCGRVTVVALNQFDKLCGVLLNLTNKQALSYGIQIGRAHV